MSPSNRKKWVAFLAGCIFLLLTAEVALRVVQAFTEPPNIDEFDLGQIDNSDRIRILTVGESTTAVNGSGYKQPTWPAILESMLNDHLTRTGAKERVAVFNMGRAASNSQFIVSELESRMEQISADIVISMMGINDRSIFFRDRYGVFFESHAFRFFYWATIAWTCPGCFRIELSRTFKETERLYSVRQLRAVGQGIRLYTRFQKQGDTSQKNVDQLLENLNKIQTAYGKDQIEMNIRIAGELFMFAGDPRIRQLDDTARNRLLVAAEKLLNTEFKLAILRDEVGLETFCNIRLALGKNCLEEIKEAIKSGVPIRAPFLTIATLDPRQKDPFIDEILSLAGFEFDPTRRSFESTRMSYLKMLKLIDKSKALWFMMQYPTGFVNGLKGFFVRSYGNDFASYSSSFYDDQNIERVDPEFESAFKSVYLISNRNFVDLVNSENQAEYFSDYFARDQGLNFGHAKRKGNEVIAKNAFDALISKWPEIRARAKLRRPSSSDVPPVSQ